MSKHETFEIKSAMGSWVAAVAGEIYRDERLSAHIASLESEGKDASVYKDALAGIREAQGKTLLDAEQSRRAESHAAAITRTP